MSNTLRLGIPSTKIKLNCRRSFAYRCSSIVRLPERRVASLRLQSVKASYDPSESSRFTSTVGSSPALLWNFTQRHIMLLNVTSCVVAVSATWLFCSAIPTLLAFKRAAESLEKLLDVTREELPGTMAAVRLSGMEISDLTMELSDLGQQITHGVRGSTRAIRFAEERMRLLTNTSPTVPMQEVSTLETKNPGPMVAKTARGMKEAVVKGRSVLQIFFTLMKFSRMALKYFASRAKS